MTDEAKSIFPPNADVSIWHVMERCALSKDEEAELKALFRRTGHDLDFDPVQPRRCRLPRGTRRCRL
jgi:hypothetical protein